MSDLLKIAKWMGKTTEGINHLGKVCIRENGLPTLYNPLTNDTQFRELLEMLLDKGWSVEKRRTDYHVWQNSIGRFEKIYNKSLPHAVLMAAEKEAGE